MIAGSSAALDLAEPGAPSSPVPASSKLPAHRLSIVVPMYNERANVEPMLDDLHAALEHYPWPWELIAVDDGSSDGTGLALEHRARALGPHVRVLCLRRNFRQTAATQAGIDAARGDVVVMPLVRTRDSVCAEVLLRRNQRRRRRPVCDVMSLRYLSRHFAQLKLSRGNNFDVRKNIFKDPFELLFTVFLSFE